MRCNRWLGKGLWELFAILFWVATLAALVMAIYEFLSGPTVVDWQPASHLSPGSTALTLTRFSPHC
jgi:hypothetical protein